MSDLKSEVNDTILEFMQTAQDLQIATKQRKEQLQKIKKMYKRLQKKKSHLKQAALKQA